MTPYEKWSLFLETLVVLILILEYWFDYKQVEKQAKKIKRRAQVRNNVDSLTTGEMR